MIDDRQNISRLSTTWQVQRFILSTSAALFNDSDAGQAKAARNPDSDVLGVPASAEVERRGAMNEAERSKNAPAGSAAGAETESDTVQERLGKLATAVVRELRKGVDVGSTAAARAQAIRR